MADLPPNQRGPDAVTHQLPAGELPAGWTLLEGQYEIVRLIASGGFGITYLARDTLGRDVAVKECFPLGLAQRAAMTHTVSATSAGTSEHFETARAQFLREARMLAGLRHAHVVHVQSLFEENGTAYMAMDFIHGRDLHEELAGDPLSGSRVLDLARDLLGALAYVHAEGVLHRDIKPQNIRIDTFGMPMLIDFGAARAETQARSRMAGTFRVVTDGYSPHEFYVSGAKQGPHSDLYALAATLHHVITGKAPIAADERASAMATGQPDPYVPIAGSYASHDTRLLHLIDRALRMVPSERPADASAWLTALTDARTTIVTPMATAAPTSSRLAAGVAIGALLMGGVGAGIWTMQPSWLSPEMEDMQEQVMTLEARLARVDAERGEAENALRALQTTLTNAEAEVQRLEEAGDDMTVTLAELEAARAARDAAAQQVTALRDEVAGLAVTATDLDDAQRQLATETARANAAEANARTLTDQITALEDVDLSARARITTLEANLTEATTRLVEARTTEALLTRAEAELTTTEAELNASMIHAATLDAQLSQAVERGADLELVQAELQTLTRTLEASQTARAQLSEEVAGLQAARAQLTEDLASLQSAPLPNLEEIAQLRADLITSQADSADLQARLGASAEENDALRARIADLTIQTRERQIELDAAVEALETSVAARGTWVPLATLQAPNGTFTLLPRFSWDNRRIAAVDTGGGITLFDRRTGAYEAHLARGIPDRVVRLGFSAGGSYLIATTPAGAPNRLYDVRTRREILRFEPVTVTTANRAISFDEQFFVFTRAAASGDIDIVITQLATLGDPSVAPVERVLTSVPEGTPVRVSFAETSNQINILTPASAQVFDTDGRLRRTAINRIGQVAALSPIGGDQGFLVLRSTGEVMVYNDLIEQIAMATVPADAAYTLYRLSGDRLSFLRANDETWNVIDLLTGEVRGTGPVAPDPQRANISISADGQMIFIGATDLRPARLLDVATGLEVQEFGDATQGYFSFDNSHLATGRADGGEAQIWRMEGAADPVLLPACEDLDRVMDGIPVLPNTLEPERTFTVEAGGDVALLSCAQANDPALARALDRVPQDLNVTQTPDVAINILGTGRDYTLRVTAQGDCDPVVLARFGEEWSLGATVDFSDTGDVTRPLDVWLATPEGTTCEAQIVLTGGEVN